MTGFLAAFPLIDALCSIVAGSGGSFSSGSGQADSFGRPSATSWDSERATSFEGYRSDDGTNSLLREYHAGNIVASEGYQPLLTPALEGETQEQTLIRQLLTEPKAKADLAAKEARAAELKGVYGNLIVLGLVAGFAGLLELLNGFGAPNTGDEFRDGHGKFANGIATSLKDAASGDAWTADGAERYDEVNAGQQQRVDSFAQAEQKIADALASQAQLVEMGRAGLAAATAAAAGAGVVAGLMYRKYCAAIAAGQYTDATVIAGNLHVFTIVTAVAVLGADLSLIITMGVEDIANQNSINGAAGTYGDIAREARRSIQPKAPVVGIPSTLESMAPRFSGLANSMPGSAVTSNAATVASGSRDGRVPVSAHTEAPGSPAFRPASMYSAGQLRSASLHPAKPPVKHAQPDAVMPEAAPPAQDEVTPGVPIDVAAPAGAERSQELTLVERMGFG